LIISAADDFKPASIDTSQPAVIDIEQGNKVKVTVPHVEVGIAFTIMSLRYTLETIYSYLSKSNFKDHYGDAAMIGMGMMGMIAEIDVFSFSDEIF